MGISANRRGGDGEFGDMGGMGGGGTHGMTIPTTPGSAAAGSTPGAPATPGHGGMFEAFPHLQNLMSRGGFGSMLAMMIGGQLAQRRHEMGITPEQQHQNLQTQMAAKRAAGL